MLIRLLFPVTCLLVVLFAIPGCSQQGWLRRQSETVPAAADPPKGTAAETPLAGATPHSVNDGVLKNPLSLARLSERRGQNEQAERLYQEVIRRSPQDPVPYHRLGVIYAKRGNLAQAEQYFSRALALSPDNPQMLTDAGYCCYLCSRTEEAERYLRRAVEINPGNAAGWNNLALLVGEQGRYDEALALFRRAGTENQAQANLAFVLAQRGEYQHALDTYNQVLTQDQKMRPAADAMLHLAAAANPPTLAGQHRSHATPPQLAQLAPGTGGNRPSATVDPPGAASPSPTVLPPAPITQPLSPTGQIVSSDRVFHSSPPPFGPPPEPPVPMAFDPRTAPPARTPLSARFPANTTVVPASAYLDAAENTRGAASLCPWAPPPAPIPSENALGTRQGPTSPRATGLATPWPYPQSPEGTCPTLSTP